MDVINPGPISSLAPRSVAHGFYDRHPMLVAAADVAIQLFAIAAVLAPLHMWIGHADLMLTALVFLGNLYIAGRILYERFLAHDHRRDHARGFLAARPLVGLWMVLVVLPLRLLLLSSAMGAVVYDLVIDHGFANPFTRSFDGWDAMLFFVDQSFRRVLFDALATFDIPVSPLALATEASWIVKASLVPFRMIVEAISFGYVWYLLEPFWRAWKDRIERKALAQRMGDGSDAPA